jgi:rhodanese-related sulfurtransferase
MSRWSQCVVCTALAGSGLVLASCGPTVSDRNIKMISLEQVRTYHVRQREDDRIMVLIDPRASSDYQRAHIPGARNMHLPDFKRGEPRNPELEAFRHIVVYGQHAGDYFAPGVTKRLLELGYDGVVFYAGGLDEWARLYNVESSVVSESLDDPAGP